jgi:hypothetical protein
MKGLKMENLLLANYDADLEPRGGGLLINGSKTDSFNEFEVETHPLRLWSYWGC